MKAKLLISLFIILSLISNLSAEDRNVNEESKNSVDKKTDVFTGDFSYIIGPGDSLEIKVLRHPDLENKVIVRPDGQISFPIIGDIRVCDLTTAELKDKLTSGLSRIINDPLVTVNVTGFQSKKIFVLGEVNRVGVYPFEGRVTVLDAISRAAGYKETAVLKSVIIIRRGHTIQPKAMRVNLWDVIDKGKISQDIYLEPGDIVFVPKSFIAKLDTFIDQFFAKTDPVLKYYLDIIDIDQRTPQGRIR